MPDIAIQVSDDVHAALQEHARRRGQSLEQYLASVLERLADRPTLHEVLDRIERRRGGQVGFGQAVQALDVERRGG